MSIPMSIGRGVKLQAIVLLALTGIVHGNAFAQTASSNRIFGRYRQFTWNDQNGLPQNSIFSIVQTQDGYLWFTTAEGAVRFDGVNFTIFGAKALKQDWAVAVSMLEDRSGNLWFAMRDNGLTKLNKGVFSAFHLLVGSGLYITEKLFEDRVGNLWIATLGRGLLRFREGQTVAFTKQNGLPSDSVHAVTEDSEGNLWIATSGGLAMLKDGRLRVFTKRDGLREDDITALCVDRRGVLWLGDAAGGLTLYVDDEFHAYAGQAKLPKSLVQELYCDRENRIWVGTRNRGIALVDGEQTLTYSIADGLPGNDILAIYQDADGAIWIGTNDGGLCQLKDMPIQVYSIANGLNRDLVGAVLQSRNGSIWIGLEQGWNRILNGIVTTPSWGRLALGGAITEDPSGNLWVPTWNGMKRIASGSVRNFKILGVAHDRLNALLADRAGNIWAGMTLRGLCRFRDGAYTMFTTKDGLAHNDVIGLYEDRAGAIWIATFNGISRFQNGQITSWSTKDGLAGNVTSCFYQDRSGAMWIGTQGGGLSRFKDGQFANISVENGLFDNLAFQILEDSEENLWMSCNRGIYRVSLRELNDFADRRIKTVTSYSYGIADGMLSRECNGASPSGWKSRDGRLWFGSLKGVVAIDPRMARLGRTPTVHIEEVIVNGQTVVSDQPIRLGVGQDNVEIKYTALSWRRPEHIRFKIQLSGLDEHWTDVGSRRSIYYSHLLPGRYAFRVIADNGNGVWNFEGQSLDLSIAGPYYRTSWFYAGSALLTAILIGAGFRYRIAQMAQSRAMQQAYIRQLLESQELERKRIAAELHDSLGQRLVIMKNLALLHLRKPTGGSRDDSKIEEISAEASGALAEVREISYALRPYQLDRLGLKEAIEALVKTVAAASQTVFSASIDDINDLFPKDAQINVYRIVQESLNNIVKHSQAIQADVAIRREGKRVLLAISDDGYGFIPAGIHSDLRKSGFGLTGIAERVQLLGGSLAIQSRPGKGTIISVEFQLENLLHGA